jgi:hypothetical protein
MKKIVEGLGAITIERRPSDKLFEPDFTRPIPNIVHTGRASAVPTHWNNSPFMSGGNYGSGALQFGANPRSKKVMSFKDFIDLHKKMQNNREE